MANLLEISLAAAVVALVPLGAIGEIREITLPALRAVPAIDGSIREPAWQHSTTIELAGGEAEPVAVRIGYSADRLFVAWRVPVPAIGLMARVQPRVEGAPAALDDAVELWLAKDANGNLPASRIVIGPRGAVWEARYEGSEAGWTVDESWRSGGSVAVHRTSTEWITELSMPLPPGALENGALAIGVASRSRRPDFVSGWPAGEFSSPASSLGRVVLGGEPVRTTLPSRAATDPECPSWREGARATVLRIGYFPYARKLRLRAELGAVPFGTAVRSMRATIRGPGGHVVAREDLPATNDRGIAETLVPLPVLEPGTYEVSLALRAGTGCEPLEAALASFEHRSFGWEHNQLGEGLEVIPPLTPLEVRDRRVTASGREYELGSYGLPDAIESLGEPLLRGPAMLVVEAGGRRRTVTPSGPIQIVDEGPASVSYRASWAAEDLHGSVEGRFEVDGLLHVGLEIDGNPDLQLERLDLVLPLRSDHASLVNGITDGTRHHTLGALPKGQGVVWDSRQPGRVELPPEFVPYVWLGDEERGLAWMADSTRDWLIAPGLPLQEIVRTPEGVDLVVHFATRSGALLRHRRIDFALQATPAKPRPAQPRPWQEWQLICSDDAAFFDVCPLGSGRYWGAATPYGNVYPLGNDPSPLLQIAAARRTGRADPIAVERWLDRHEIEGEARERMQAGLQYAQVAAARKPDAAVLYINAHSAAWGPEFAIYGDEWRPAPFGDRTGNDGGVRGLASIRPSQSWQDFMLFYLDRMLESEAADGFFFDNAYLRASFDVDFGTAWRDEEGRLWPGVDLFELRQFLRRAQTLVWRRRGAWMNVAHMTTTPIAPVHSWAGIALDGEWKYGLDDYQDRFPRALLRAASLGTQLGSISVYLPGLVGNATRAKRTFLERSLAGTTAVHEIRVMGRMEGALETIWRNLARFGYGRSDCRVFRYWDGGDSFQIVGGDAEALVLVRNGKALVLLVSFSGDAKVRVQLDPEKLGVPAQGRCVDVEGAEVSTNGSSCELMLPRHDFRILRFEGGS